ncbi:hypothetical protein METBISCDRAFT_15347 [Metschnikowia bicuspidata]|uniref:ARID domain-containing protein n=1 Tax=Metschnikowia bicuspidata TaxID=27322 RepID=A0A4P9ZEG4_9ASCO|nr:hypothetical protein METBISCDRAFT_15347 [Metschnikowia bicuspidata]
MAGQQQASLEKAKQDKMLKMRQQIMQQQMLQRQMPQQLPHMGLQMTPSYPNDMLSGMGRKSGPKNQTNSMPPYGGAGAPAPINMLQANTGMPKAPFKLTPAQISQLQHELFMMCLDDFMSRKGTPITQPPMIGNKRVNLLALQVLTRKIGGSSAVLRHLQMLSQLSAQFTEWSTICLKLALFENIDVANNVMAKQQVEKLLATCYLQYISPYEQYAQTEQGHRDLLARRMQFQKQLVMRMQQQMAQQGHAPNQPMPGQMNTNQQLPQQQPASSYNSPSLMSRPASGLHQINMQAMKARMPNGAADLAQLPGTPSAMGNASPAVSQAAPLHNLSQQSSAHNSPALAQLPFVPPAGRSNSVQPQQIAATDGDAPRKPNTIKKYTPIKKVADPRSYLLKKISDLGEKIEVLKPVYLFAPELGSLNLHALTMSLNNYSASNEGEAFSALNTLLVTTADDSFLFDVSGAPELVLALVGLGRKVLARITGAAASLHDYTEVNVPASSAIDATFRRYVSPHAMQGEDVAFVVDSLTGDVVDDDSDIDVDDVFLPALAHVDLDSAPDEQLPISVCSVPDYMAAMHQFRAENKHHFSKMQTKGPLSEQVFLVDSLVTVLMTLRNLSLSTDSARVMANSSELRDLVFETIKQVATHPEAFVLTCKRLCLLKDCLVISNQHGSHIELQSMEQAFLVYLLVSAFGPALGEHDDDPDPARLYELVRAPLEHYIYLPYAVDMFAKLLVREPHNRAYFQAVLGGTLNVKSSAACPGSDSVSVLPADHHETKRLVAAYFHGDLAKLRRGVLLTRAYHLLMSVVPFSVSGGEFSRAIFAHTPAILQALFAAKLLVDFVPSDELKSPLACVILRWLSYNNQRLVLNLTKSVFVFIAELAKVPPHTAEHKITVLVSARVLIMVNSLFANALRVHLACAEGEMDASSCVADLARLRHLYRILHDGDFLLNSLSASGVAPDLTEQIWRLRGLMAALNEGKVG